MASATVVDGVLRFIDKRVDFEGQVSKCTIWMSKRAKGSRLVTLLDRMMWFKWKDGLIICVNDHAIELTCVSFWWVGKRFMVEKVA